MSTEPTPQQPSGEIQQVLGGNKNQAIGEMSGGTAFSTVEGSVSIIYNYYYHREPVDSESVESPDTANDENLPCPYRGLFHFSPNDVPYFFGREVFIKELFAATQTRNFIPVLGASGSGKSSVVLAGLVPKLLNEGHWLFTHFRPGADPFYALAEALVPLYISELDSTDKMTQAGKLAKSLNEGELSLAKVFSNIQRQYPNHRVLLIADQFEEIYTLCSEQKVRHIFLDTLLASFKSSPSPSQYNHVLVATMRADFLGNALSYPQFGELLRNNDIKIRSMNREELTQVIEKPADKLGITFQAGLVKRILDDVDLEPGNLPLLEFALTELWKRRRGRQLTHTAYEEIGEVKGALTRHADENYRKLGKTEQEQAQRIFIQLVHPGERTEDTRRIATRTEVGEENWDLVTSLADARLVVTGRNEKTGLETVEIVHETLIRSWGQLNQWMQKDRDFRQWQEQLRSAMRTWKSSSNDEGALLRGKPLADAEYWQGKRLVELSAVERSFIGLSVELFNREKQEEERRQQYKLTLERQARYRLQWLVAVLAATLLITTSFISYPLVLRWQALVQGKMVKIPSGEFIVGTDNPKADKDEKPQKRRFLPEFEIEKYEVSNSQYKLCIKAGACFDPVKGLNRFNDKRYLDHPVVGVTAMQAYQYCRWLGRRLPTELEWERTARGSNGRLWPWGNINLTPQYANVVIGTYKPFGTEPVTSISSGSSLEGVYNLVGNVWEWTASYSNSDKKKHIWDGQVETEALALRGGSWKDNILRISSRTPSLPNIASDRVGMRCAK